MSGVLFIVTIPTEVEERLMDRDRLSKSEISFKTEYSQQGNENGAFKIVRSILRFFHCS